MARSPLDAKAAQRAALARAQRASLTVTDWKVLGALLELMTLYDRNEDRLANSQLQRATGITDDRRIRKSTKHLAELGIIEREPGGGRPGAPREASLYRVPWTQGPDEPGAETPGVPEERDPGSTTRITPGSHGPASEVLSETDPEVSTCERCNGSGAYKDGGYQYACHHPMAALA